ncbi:uncharacterized protein LOC135366211 [Ornithodoros turicata]|uniref:uncharacterized protein LOC135366211 n=1 Tax=Ornithodoros turicata TaxID=34597 RepID=UPI0031394B38
MACKFAVVALCLFVVGNVDAAPNDAWSVLSGGKEFFLVSRSYVKTPGTNECAYMKEGSVDADKHELTTKMGYRDGSTKQFVGPATYTITVNADASGTYNEVVVQGDQAPAGITYNLVYSDGNGCNILKGKGGMLDGKCELWAPAEKVADAQGTSCSQQFQNSCGAAVETPYKSGCTIPQTA